VEKIKSMAVIKWLGKINSLMRKRKYARSAIKLFFFLSQTTFYLPPP